MNEVGNVEDARWEPYDPAEDHTVVGDVMVSNEFRSPLLRAPRHLLAYLPPSYRDSDERYPVIYMHDGQNLFDERTSYAGEWRVDETMEALAEEGIEAIVIGVPNADEDRGYEYTPFADPEFGGGGADDYLEWLVETVKPIVDERFRTRPERKHTGIAGSSLGGLVTLYGFFDRSETFGFAGVMSPAFWWAEKETLAYFRAQSHVPGRLYVDVGGNERPEDPERTRAYLEDARTAVGHLQDLGYDNSQLRFVVEDGARHREAAWARRFPDAIRFLLS